MSVCLLHWPSYHLFSFILGLLWVTEAVKDTEETLYYFFFYKSILGILAEYAIK